MSIKKGNNTIAGGVIVDNVPTSGSSNPVSSGGVYTALAGKADIDLSTVSATGKSTAIGWGLPDLTTGVSVSSSGFTSTKKQWLCIRAGASNNYFNVLVNGVIVSTIYSSASTNTSDWYPLDVGDVVTFAGTSSYFDCATYDMKGL